MLFIWSYNHTVRLCISCLVVCSRGLAPCAPFWMTARTRVRTVLARCGTQADGSTVWSAVAVGSVMRSRPFAGCVVTSQVSGEMTADSTAGPVHSLGVKRRYSFLERHRQSYIFGAVTNKLLLAVS